MTIDVTSNGDVSEAKDTCNIISEKNPSNVTHAALSVKTDDASHGDVSDGPNNAVDGTDTPNNSIETHKPMIDNSSRRWRPNAANETIHLRIIVTIGLQCRLDHLPCDSGR